MLCSIPAHAMEARASTRIAHSTVTLSKKSNGDFSIFFSVQGVGKMDVIGASSVEVQNQRYPGDSIGKQISAQRYTDLFATV